MFVSIRVTGGALAAAALMLGCSSGGDRTTARDTTSAMTTGAAAPDSTASMSSSAADNSAAQPDTVTAASNTTTPSKSAAVAPAPSAQKPRVKPSIDPGRVSKKPAAESTATRTESTASSADSTPAQPAAAAGQQDQNPKYDAASNTVTFQLIGGPNGFQFNGFSNGGATLTLPPKANVVIHFVNKDGTPHSAEVIPGDGPIPNSSTDPAIPRAYTNKALEGLPQESGDDMRFTVPATGTYRIFCGVPGHGLSGMWIWMKVDPAAKTPSFGPTKA
jgi:plastocyanin